MPTREIAMHGLFELSADGRSMRFVNWDGQVAEVGKGGVIELDNGLVKVRLEFTKLWVMDKKWREEK